MHIKTQLLAFTVLLITQTAVAQYNDNYEPMAPRWHSDKGYWMVESNINNPRHAVVRFYTPDSKLIYTETVTGVELNCRKKRTLVKLKKMMERVVEAHESGSVAEIQGGLSELLNNKKKRA